MAGWIAFSFYIYYIGSAIFHIGSEMASIQTLFDTSRPIYTCQEISKNIIKNKACL